MRSCFGWILIILKTGNKVSGYFIIFVSYCSLELELFWILITFGICVLIVFFLNIFIYFYSAAELKILIRYNRLICFVIAHFTVAVATSSYNLA